MVQRRRKPLPKNRGGSKRSLRSHKTTPSHRKAAKKREQERIWRLESGITYSALSQFIQDPESFYLNYVQGLTPRRMRKPIEFGSIIHLMLEHQFSGKRKKAPKTVANEIATAYEATRAKTVLANERESLHILVEVARMLFPLYCDYWKAEDAEINWINREQQFRVPFEFTDLDHKPRVVYLRGMRDGFFQDEGGYGVFETKTKEQIDQESIRSQLRADMQTLLYMLTASIEFKVQPKQILYNLIRRPGQHHKSESVTDFVKRIKEDIESRPQHYFMRWHVDVTTRDYDNFTKHTLVPILCKFVQWVDSVTSKKNRWDSPYHYLNLNGLLTKFGKSEYWEAIINGRQSVYYQRSATFPELEESIL